MEIDKDTSCKKIFAAVSAAKFFNLSINCSLEKESPDQLSCYEKLMTLKLDQHLSDKIRLNRIARIRLFQSIIEKGFSDSDNKQKNSSDYNLSKSEDSIIALQGSRNCKNTNECNVNNNFQLRKYLLKQLACTLNLVSIETWAKSVDNKRCFTKNSEPYMQDLKSIKRFEPRIDYIAKHLYSVLNMNKTHGKDNNILSARSFRLKNIKDWLVDSDIEINVRDPYINVLQYLSWECRCSCKFCLHKNDPPFHWTKSLYHWKKSCAEIETRLNYFDPENAKAIFRSQDYNSYEVLTHPNFMNIIKTLRTKTDGVIGLATNGVMLNNSFIQQLSLYKPLYFMVSLNSANHKIRKKIMGDRKPHSAINSLRILKDNRFLYSVSIVPWHEIPLSDVADTICYADENKAYVIRINIGGYSAHHLGYENTKENQTVQKWQKDVIELVQSLRSKIQTPILFQPSLIDKLHFQDYGIEAEIDGVIRNSPAALSGLQYGDKIVQIDDFSIGFKNIAKNILSNYHALGIEEISLKVERNGKLMLINLTENFSRSNAVDTYPHFSTFRISKYGMDPVYPYGIVLQPTLHPGYFLEIERLIKESGAKNILFLSSQIVAPIFSRLVALTKFFQNKEYNFTIDIPSNSCFLKGNIMVGDLLTVEDFINCINNQKEEFDLVIIPSSPFGAWQRDISGRPFADIERSVNIPIKLIKNEVIYAI